MFANRSDYDELDQDTGMWGTKIHGTFQRLSENCKMRFGIRNLIPETKCEESDAKKCEWITKPFKIWKFVSVEKKVENQFFWLNLWKSFGLKLCYSRCFGRKASYKDFGKSCFSSSFSTCVRGHYWIIVASQCVVDGRQQAIEGHGILLPSHHLHRKKFIFWICLNVS